MASIQLSGKKKKKTNFIKSCILKHTHGGSFYTLRMIQKLECKHGLRILVAIKCDITVSVFSSRDAINLKRLFF